MAARLTAHARHRSSVRQIPGDAIEAALDFGQRRAIRGADIYTIGWRDVRRWSLEGMDLSRWQGVEVVCARDGQVITVYRNSNPRAMRDRELLRRAA